MEKWHTPLSYLAVFPYVALQYWTLQYTFWFLGSHTSECLQFGLTLSTHVTYMTNKSWNYFSYIFLLERVKEHTADMWANAKYSNMFSNQKLVRPEAANQKGEKWFSSHFLVLLLFFSQLQIYDAHYHTQTLTDNGFLQLPKRGRGHAYVHWPIRS